ncbi:MAG: SulP family inorganic anion transporter [Sulfuriferula sp.]|nr:SulP family inorganic anion transporter [Sulfuriferula sp.]
MVDKSTTKSDLIAGLTGAMIVLPQGVAFATIAGLPPEFGLYAAMVPAIIGAMFGSSWHLVSGPTTAISIAVFASVSPYAEPGSAHYISLVLTLTFMAGLFQLIMGLARMGVLVNFISHTVVIGFTAGAAVLIAGSQIKNFLGLQMARGLPFHEVLEQVYLQFDKINPYVTAVGAVTLVSGILLKKYMPKLYMILAMVIGSVAALIINQMYGGAEVTHIKTVGALTASLPPLTHPDLSLAAIKQVLFPSLIVTMLALTEAVSISRAIAVKSEQRIDGNQEFVGQGLSNLFGSFFSSYPSSGSFNRSGVNYAAGAKTPLAAVYSSVFLVIILLMVASLAAYLPTAAMAGILFLVAYGLIDFHHIHSILHTSRQETAILAVTLIGTLVDLEKGIFLGIMLSLMLYLYRTSRPEVVAVVPDPDPESYYYVRVNQSPECPQMKILRVQGSIFFGAVNHVQQIFQDVDEHNPQQKSLLIAAGGIGFVDIAGAEMLKQEAQRRKKLGGGLYFYRVQQDVCELFGKGDYMDGIGADHIFPPKTRPIDSIYPQLDSEICRNCSARIFAPCHVNLPNGEPRK